MKHLNTKLRTLLGAVIFSIVFTLSISTPGNGGIVETINFDEFNIQPGDVNGQDVSNIYESRGVLFEKTKAVYGGVYAVSQWNVIVGNAWGLENGCETNAGPITIRFPKRCNDGRDPD